MPHTNKTLVFLTVPRTGTAFFMKILGRHYPSMAVYHVSTSAFPRLDRALCTRPAPVVITTWRDWNKVRASFRKHGDVNFDAYYISWLRLVREYDPAILTVELEYQGVSRHKRLSDLGRRLGVKFETDWVPVDNNP